jgi:hypothetical protein
MRLASMSFFILFLVCLFASIGRSQTTQSQQQTAPPAQSSDAAQAQPAQTAPKPANQSRPQKVWTNEDVQDLRDHSEISTIGKPQPPNANANNQPARNTTRANATWYRDQLKTLRSKLPPLDEKIQQLQAALSGKTVDSVRQAWGVMPDDWRDQLARLQKQRADIQAKITTLEDEARHNGVPQTALEQ